MPKHFIAFLNSEENIRNASILARKVSANVMLSSMLDLDTPANFMPMDYNNDAISFTGTMSNGNKNIDFVFKKAFLLNLFGYKLSATSNNVKVGFKYYANSKRPDGDIYRDTYSLYVGNDEHVSLASGAYYKTGKDGNTKLKLNGGDANAKGNKKPFCGSKFQYDWNGDILITNVINKDKGFWYSWVLTDASEYLGVVETKVRIKHNDFKTIKSLSVETTKIDRARSMGFFEAFMQKSTAGTISAEELSNTTTKKELNFAKQSIKKDDKGNCISEKNDNIEISRTFVY